MVEQIVSRSDGSEHFLHRARGRSGIACSVGSRAKGSRFDGIADGWFWASHDFDKRRNSSSATRTSFSGTSFTISTLPISRGRTKCIFPSRVFLSRLQQTDKVAAASLDFRQTTEIEHGI